MAATKRADLLNVSGTDDLFTTFIEPQVIPTLENELVLYKLGVPRAIPANSGDTIQIQFPSNLTSSTVPVDELAGGFANTLSWTTATMQVLFYANDVQFSQLVDAINMTNYRDSAFGRLAYNAAETADLIARNSLDGNTTQDQVVNDKTVDTDLQATDTLTVSEINDATTTLRVANVMPHPMAGNAYILVIHNRVAGDLRGDTGGGSNPNALTWYDTVRRGDVSMFENARLGRTTGAEILETSNITNSTDATTGANYYINHMMGADYFMTGALSPLVKAPSGGENAGSPLVHLIPPEHSQATPHGNRYILSWQMYTAAGQQDNNRGLRLIAGSGA